MEKATWAVDALEEGPGWKDDGLVQLVADTIASSVDPRRSSFGQSVSRDAGVGGRARVRGRGGGREGRLRNGWAGRGKPTAAAQARRRACCPQHTRCVGRSARAGRQAGRQAPLRRAAGQVATRGFLPASLPPRSRRLAFVRGRIRVRVRQLASEEPG